MLQDMFPLRSGVPDGVELLLKINVTVAATTWLLDTDRLQPGVVSGPAAVTPGGLNVFAATGIASIQIPTGYKVRHARVSVSAPTTTVADQRSADWTFSTALELAGAFGIAITDRAVPALANPVVNSVIWAALTLETV
jgi:hypothetical protein